MKRLKTFLIYVILIVTFTALSDFLIYMALKGTYNHINTNILAKDISINVAESKATYINGYVKGNIYNDTNGVLNKYIKMDFYSKRNVHLGTKYVKVENLEQGKNMNFEMWFKFQDVKYCNISVVDNAENSTSEEFISEETKYSLVLGSLVLLYFL